MIAVSRCLIGENCTYAGKNNLCKEIKELYDQDLVLPLCPEVLGGLPIPRTPCEVIGEKVIDQKGIDLVSGNLGHSWFIGFLVDFSQISNSSGSVNCSILIGNVICIHK